MLPTTENITKLLSQIIAGERKCYRYEDTEDVFHCVTDEGNIIILCKYVNRFDKLSYVSYMLTDDFGTILLEEYFNERHILYPTLSQCYEAISNMATVEVD